MVRMPAALSHRVGDKSVGLRGEALRRDVRQMMPPIGVSLPALRGIILAFKVRRGGALEAGGACVWQKVPPEEGGTLQAR